MHSRQPNGAVILPRTGQGSPTETCREISWMKPHWSEAHSSVAFLPSMSCLFSFIPPILQMRLNPVLEYPPPNPHFFFFKFSKSFDFCSNCACYMYICWKLAISSESHKILQEVITVLHCKAMMRSQKVNAVLGDHGHILSHKGVGKKNVVQIWVFFFHIAFSYMAAEIPTSVQKLSSFIFLICA